MIGSTKNISIKTAQKGSSVDGIASLHVLIWKAALNWVLGKKGDLYVEAQSSAVKFGVASLMHVDKKLHCVVREPLLLEALLGKDPAAAFESILHESPAQLGLDFEDYLGLRMDRIIADLSEAINKEKIVPPEFKREWEFKSPANTYRRGVRAQDGEEVAWLRNELTSPSNLVCFPATRMGPDLIYCAYAKEDPQLRLVVLIQAKTGVNESTPAAFRTLSMLYTEDRDKKSPHPANGLETQKTEIDEFLKTCLVLHLVIKPKNSSRFKPIRMEDGVLKMVVDARNLASLPSAKVMLDKLKE
jgi:hypothetical protein